MREEKRLLLLPSGFVIVLISLILVNFGSSDTTHTVNKRSTDTSYYNNHYSRPDYNAKANSRQLTSSSTGAYYDQEEFGNYAAAGSHGGGHYSGGGGYGGGGGHGGGGYGHGGGGGGHGGGHGGGGYGKGSNVNSSAVGLLGFLALLSLIQNVLRQMTTTIAVNMTGRRRRNADDFENEDDTDAIEMDLNLDLDMDKPTWSPPTVVGGGADDARITTLVLPMLTAVAHAKDGLVPHRCVHRPLCKANKLLVQELGDHGASIGAMVSKAVGKFLSGNNGKNNNHLRGGDNLSHSQQKIVDAGKNGRTTGQEQCDEFEHCILLNNLPTYGLPPSGSF